MAFQTDMRPGSMTDWQQPLVVALTQATGIPIVHETVYEERFDFTEALSEMGTFIQAYRECLEGLLCRLRQRNFHHSTVVQGPTKLRAANIGIPDLCGGFSHLIATLAAEGESVVSGTNIIDRRYEHFMQKLRALDVSVVREG